MWLVTSCQTIARPGLGGCLEYIGNIVADAKGRLKDPYVVVSGDFNQWDITTALEEFTDFVESSNDPTRGTLTIDRTHTNFDEITVCGTLAPLYTEDEKESDHLVCYNAAKLRRRPAYKWQK